MTTHAPYTWSADTLQAATQGTWQALTGGLSTTCITTDTRSIKAGDVFLAIKGDNFDGHDYVNVAQEKGAVAVIVNHAVSSQLPQLIVSDTKKALGLLGKYRRDAHPDLTVVALTGSSGKTTTKEMIGSILNQIAPTLITRGNLNNDLGVPMMLLELSDEHRFAVMELGANHVGEIAYTADLVSPDVACVLNIGTAHLGEFGGRANIARAKAEIYSALTSDGVAVLPMADEFCGFLAEQATQFTQNTLTFGECQVPLGEADLSDEDVAMLSEQGVQDVMMAGDIFADDVVVANTHSDFVINTNLDVDQIESLPVRLPFLGEHNVQNALAAASCAYALGLSLELIVSGLERAVAPKGRLTRIELGRHVLIDDTYNANPMSILAAAQVLEQESGQKILVLGDVFELGDAAKDEHEKLGEQLANLDLDAVYAVGEHMAYAVAAINRTKPIAQHFADKASLFLTLAQSLDQADSTALFKGSRGMKMESLIADLQQSYN